MELIGCSFTANHDCMPCSQRRRRHWFIWLWEASESDDAGPGRAGRRRIACGRTAMTVRRLISEHIVVCRAVEWREMTQITYINSHQLHC